MEIAQDSTPVITFWLVKDTDYVTGDGGETPSVKVSKNGGAFASIDNSVSEISDGLYKFTLSSDETDTVGDLNILAENTGSAPWRQTRQVTAAAAGTVSATLSQSERNAIADATLRRDLSNTVSASGPDTIDQYSALVALMKLIGKISTAGSTESIYLPDGTTVAGQLTLTTSASAEVATAQTPV